MYADRREPGFSGYNFYKAVSARIQWLCSTVLDTWEHELTCCCVFMYIICTNSHLQTPWLYVLDLLESTPCIIWDSWSQIVYIPTEVEVVDLWKLMFNRNYIGTQRVHAIARTSQSFDAIYIFVVTTATTFNPSSSQPHSRGRIHIGMLPSIIQSFWVSTIVYKQIPLNLSALASMSSGP